MRQNGLTCQNITFCLVSFELWKDTSQLLRNYCLLKFEKLPKELPWPISCDWYLSLHRLNIRKPEVFWYFQGVCEKRTVARNRLIPIKWALQRDLATFCKGSELYLEPCQASMMESFSKIVTSMKLLTIFAKEHIIDFHSILNTPQGNAVL